MNFNLSTLKTAGRALLVAAVVGTGAMAVATPTQAQGLSFNFSIGPGGQPGFGFGIGRPWPRNFCMSDREMVRALRNEGFRNIDVEQSNRRVARVEADRRGWEYDMRVNKCNGNITVLDRDRIRGRR